MATVKIADERWKLGLYVFPMRFILKMNLETTADLFGHATEATHWLQVQGFLRHSSLAKLDHREQEQLDGCV